MVIIGSSCSSLDLAHQAARLGGKVCLIEEENSKTLDLQMLTKQFLQTCNKFHSLKGFAADGININGAATIDFAQLMKSVMSKNDKI